MSNLTDLIDGIAEALSKTADKVAADARNATDPTEADRLRNLASTGHRLARATGSLRSKIADAEKKVADNTAAQAERMRTLVAESRARDGLRDIDPISADAPTGTQYRRIVAGNLLADIGKLGEERICGTLTDNGMPCVLREHHKPPRYDEDQPYHADAEQAARARRYLIHSDPDKTQRG